MSSPISIPRDRPCPPHGRRTPAAALLVTLALSMSSFAGCDSAKTKDAAAGTDDALIAAWRKAGLEVSPLTEVDAKPYQATACRGGTAAGVDVTVCRYDTAEDAHAAEDLGLAAVGGATGASIAHGSRLLVVADRRKTDPSGRTIDAILKAFKP